MSVRFFYVDESYDDTCFCLSAIGIRHTEWRECLSRVRQHRMILKQDHGIFLRKEIHAHEFVSGRGRISEQELGKYRRTQIFEGLLRLVAQLPNVMVINVCLGCTGRANPQMDAWNRLLNRIERCMLGMEERELPLRRELVATLPRDLSHSARRQIDARLNHYRPRAVVIADEGREPEITRTLRQMHTFNPVPSRLGTWDDGRKSRNIPLERVIEDPVFKSSHQSYFLQLADCVAFSLLKSEVLATPNVKRYAIHRMFSNQLSGVCLRSASRSDPLGIVRK